MKGEAMKKKSFIAIIASILILLGTGSFGSPQPVSAAKHQIFVSSKTYVYDHKGKKTKKVYKKSKSLYYTSIKKIKGYKYYRIGKNKYIHYYDGLPINIVKTPKNRPAKNGASLMDFMANDSSLTTAQRQEAQKAATLLRTGKIDNQAQKGAPSWFNTYVKLGGKDDATSNVNIKASLQSLANANKERKRAGVGELKISPTSTAISMIDADYQKQGSLNHPGFYGYHFNLENLSAGAEPISNWMTEKVAWEWNVKKSPSLAPYEFTPNWEDPVYNQAVLGTNGYRMAGHYTNLLNKGHRVMGMAHMTQTPYGAADAFNATSEGEDGAITLAQYKAIVKEWLKK